MKGSRIKIIAARWSYVVATGLAAGAMVLVLEPIATPPVESLGEFISELTPTRVVACALVICVLAVWFALQALPRHFARMRSVPRYPPAWIGALFGITTTLLIANKIDGENISLLVVKDREIGPYLWWAWSVVSLSIIVAFIVDWQQLRLHRARASLSKARSPATGAAMPLTWERIHLWIQTDTPIRDDQDDLLGNAAIAARIARLLDGSRERQAIALIGPRGAGKTSILNLVKRQHRGNSDLLIVQVSVWEYESPEAAIRGVLHSTVDSLDCRVDTTAIRGISEDYVQAIEQSTGRLAGLTSFLRPSKSPREILTRLSRVATAAGIHVVVWIEDLERFGAVTSSASTMSVHDRLAPIRVLLYLLEEVDNVSIVVADGGLDAGFDIEKIARFVEYVPRLARGKARQILRLLRQTCLAGWPVPIIDPADARARAEFLIDEGGVEFYTWLSNVREKPLDVAEAILELVETPRTLKLALRDAVETWTTMPGEIDMDSLLAVAALRASNPDIWLLIERHIDLFVNGFSDPAHRDDAKKPPHSVLEEFEQLIAKKPVGHRAALMSVVEYLFPHYRLEGSREGLLASLRRSRPQSLFADSHTSYWRRYMSRSPIPAGESDQLALRSIQEWQSGAQSDLPSRMLDDQRAAQVESFAAQIDQAQLLRLLSEVCALLLGLDATSWEGRRDAPGLTSLWRMIRSADVPAEELGAVLEREIQTALRVHLPLAHSLRNTFALRSAGVKLLIPNAVVERVDTLVAATFAAAYAGSDGAARLNEALRDGSPWIVYWLVWGLDRIRANLSSGQPFKHWPNVAEALLTLAESAPSKGVPILVPFITSRDERPAVVRSEPGGRAPHRGWSARFRLDAATELFGDVGLERLARALLLWAPLADVDEGSEIGPRLSAAQEWARSQPIGPRTAP